MLYNVLVGFGAGAVLAALLAYLWGKFFLSSYLSEKGKNLATKEDIEDITRKIEGVRTQYATLIEEFKARHQLRVAALDRRLQAHQEAFTLWRELLAVTHTEEVGKVVINCQSWWEKNCVYLEPQVRESFVRAYSAAHMHNSLVKSHADAQLVKDNWKEITDFSSHVFSAVQLPGLSELEAKSLDLKLEEVRRDDK